MRLSTVAARCSSPTIAAPRRATSREEVPSLPDSRRRLVGAMRAEPCGELFGDASTLP